jgi:Glycosyltransferase family 87
VAATALPATAGAATEGALPGGSIYDRLPKPNPVAPILFNPTSMTKPPPSFAISARQAIRFADRTRTVRKARAQYGRLKPTPYISPLKLPQGTFYHWDIIYTADHGKRVAEVELGRTGTVFAVESGADVGWSIQRGYKGILGNKLNAPYVWLPLCFLFLLPFVDPKRWRRLLHLDLLMLLAFGISHYFFNLGKPDLSVPLVYPFLLYVVVRMLFAAFRPARRQGQLMPYMSTGFIAAILVLLLGLRIAFGFAGSTTFDISTAGVIGADRIEHGLPLYQENIYHGDTYGPINYMMYIPFELLVPYHVETGPSWTAKPATLTFDLLTVLGLFLLGRRLRQGRSGTRLGLGLAYAWTAYPYTSLVIASNTNDALVPLFLVFALIFLRSPPARGLFAGLGSMAKFAPLVVAPIIVGGTRPLRARTTLIAGAVAAAVCIGLVWAFLPDGGLREFWNTTLGFQLGRTSPLSLWQREPSLQWLQTVLKAALAAVAIAAAFVPRRRTVGQVAAISGALLAGSQLIANYWIYFYAAWLVPFVVIAAAVEYRTGQASATSSFVKPVRISQPSSVTATRSSMRTPRLPGR